MKVNELFKKIENYFVPEELNGEFQLQGNCIVWTYDLDNDSEEIEAPSNSDEEEDYSFDAYSPEELLLEAYADDKESLERLLDELDEIDNWTFSEPETNGNIISFKIF